LARFAYQDSDGSRNGHSMATAQAPPEYKRKGSEGR
jgi:hypothetical protein